LKAAAAGLHLHPFHASVRDKAKAFEWSGLARPSSEGREIGVEVGNGLNSAEIILECEVFVGSVCVFIGETEADQYAGDFEGVMHLRDERYRAPFANEDRFFPEALFERALRNFKNRRMERRYPRFASAEDFELAGNGFWQESAYVFFDQL